MPYFKIINDDKPDSPAVELSAVDQLEVQREMVPDGDGEEPVNFQEQCLVDVFTRGGRAVTVGVLDDQSDAKTYLANLIDRLDAEANKPECDQNALIKIHRDDLLPETDPEASQCVSR